MKSVVEVAQAVHLKWEKVEKHRVKEDEGEGEEYKGDISLVQTNK